MKELQTPKSLSRLKGTGRLCLVLTLAVFSLCPLSLTAQTRVGRDGGSGSDTSTATITVPSLTSISNVYMPQTFTSCHPFELQEGTAPTLTTSGSPGYIEFPEGDKRPTITITGYLGHLSQTAFFADPPYRRPRYVKCGRERIDAKGGHYHVCWDRKLKKRSRFYVPVIIISNSGDATWRASTK